MAESDVNRIPTNDEIVNELTKDLASQQFDLNEETKESTKTENSGVPNDFDDSDSDSNINGTTDDDYIDEEALKDLEVTFTSEEKEIRHKQALELKNKGNEEFKNAKYLESVQSYTEALRICPLVFDNDRSIFYANRGASKIKLDRIKSAIDDCTKALELNDKYVRAYLRRAKLYEDTEKLEECLEDYKKILELDPGNKEALMASHRLPPLIQERNEKLKNEMFGKLKDLGNMFLKPFGLSTDNFQMQQDPNSGGYSINFQQNANR